MRASSKVSFFYSKPFEVPVPWAASSLISSPAHPHLLISRAASTELLPLDLHLTLPFACYCAIKETHNITRLSHCQTYIDSVVRVALR